MIHDHVSRLQIYRTLSPHIARAIEFVSSTDLSRLAAGRHEVDGERVFATLYETQTLVGGARWESHRKYIDLQLMLAGEECQQVADITRLDGATPYDLQKDVQFYTGTANPLTVHLRDGHFVIYFPHDGHLPMIAASQPAPIRKLVLKIAAT